MMIEVERYYKNSGLITHVMISSIGWDGTGEGDELPCGRIVTKDDTEIIYDRITNREDDY